MKVLSVGHQTSVAKHAASLLQMSNSQERLALATIVFLHLALVIPLAAVLNLWIDEAYTLQSTDGGLVHAVQRALGFELQPPLYFVLLTLWRILDDSYFFARLFSIACTTSTVVLVAGLARRYVPGVPPVFAAAAVAFNPLTVFLAVNVRFYALTLLLSALLLQFFYDGYLAEDSSARVRRRFVLVAVVGLYTHYFLGFLLAGGAVVLLFLGRFDGLRRYLFGMAVTAALFLPLAVITIRQVATVAEATASSRQTLRAGVTQVWWAIWNYLLPVSQNTALAVVRVWTSRLAGPLLLLAVLARRRWPPAPPLLAILTLAAVVGLFLVGSAMLLGSDFMRLEHPTVLFLPVMFAGLGLLHYVGGARVRVVALGVMASVIFSGTYLIQTYALLAKPGDWIRVSHYIERHETASEPILVFPGEFTLDFGYHYGGINQIVALPRAMGEETYDPRTRVLRDEGEILQVIMGKLSAHRRFWVVTGLSGPFRGIDIHPEILEGFLVRRCVVLRDKSFLASRVRLLELKPEGVIK